MRRLTMDGVEAAYLGGLVGGEALFGLPDPFAGWLSDEIVQGLNRARDRLIQRSVVQVGAGGAITLDPGAQLLLEGWVQASVSATAVITPAGSTASTRHYHMGAAMTVEHLIYPGMGMYELREMAGPDAVATTVVELFGLEDQPAPGLHGGQISETALREARLVAEGAGLLIATEALTEGGMAPQVAQALASTLAEPVASASLVVFDRRSHRWSQDGIAMICGLNGWWIIRPFQRGETPWVELHPCTGTQVAGAVTELWDRGRKALRTIETTRR